MAPALGQMEIKNQKSEKLGFSGHRMIGYGRQIWFFRIIDFLQKEILIKFAEDLRFIGQKVIFGLSKLLWFFDEP